MRVLLKKLVAAEAPCRWSDRKALKTGSVFRWSRRRPSTALALAPRAEAPVLLPVELTCASVSSCMEPSSAARPGGCRWAGQLRKVSSSWHAHSSGCLWTKGREAWRIELAMRGSVTEGTLPQAVTHLSSSAQYASSLPSTPHITMDALS